jgi:hypothetical protein
VRGSSGGGGWGGGWWDRDRLRLDSRTSSRVFDLSSPASVLLWRDLVCGRVLLVRLDRMDRHCLQHWLSLLLAITDNTAVLPPACTALLVEPVGLTTWALLLLTCPPPEQCLALRLLRHVLPLVRAPLMGAALNAVAKAVHLLPSGITKLSDVEDSVKSAMKGAPDARNTVAQFALAQIARVALAPAGAFPVVEAVAHPAAADAPWSRVRVPWVETVGAVGAGHAARATAMELVGLLRHLVTFEKTEWRCVCGLPRIAPCVASTDSPGSRLPPPLACGSTECIAYCHPLSPTVTHCHPLSPTVTHCHPLSPTVTHCHPLSSTVTHFHTLSLSRIIARAVTLLLHSVTPLLCSLGVAEPVQIAMETGRPAGESADPLVVGREAERAGLATAVAAMWVLGGVFECLRPGAAFRMPRVSSGHPSSGGGSFGGTQQGACLSSARCAVAAVVPDHR